MGLFGRKKRESTDAVIENAKPVRLATVHEGAAVQLLEVRTLERAMHARGHKRVERVDDVVVSLARGIEGAIDVTLDGKRVGSVGRGRRPEFLAVIKEAEAAGHEAQLLAHVTHTTAWSLYLERYGSDPAVVAARKAKKKADADARAVTLANTDVWVVTIDGDFGDMDADFEPDAFRRRVAKARRTGSNMRFEWDEDLVETYDVTPELVIEMYCDHGDGTSSEPEILNGPNFS